MPEPEEYTIGWISALDTEYTAARALLDNDHGRIDDIDIRDTNDYTLGQMGSHKVVIAALPHWQPGLVNATAVAKDMARTFSSIRFILMVGVGGGVPTKHDIRLGDVVVSSAGYGNGGVIQYDYGHADQNKRFRTTGHLNQPPMALLAAITGLKSDHMLRGHGIDHTVEKMLQNQNPTMQATYRRPDAENDRLYQPDFVHPDKHKSCTEMCQDSSESKLIKRDDREAWDRLKIHYGLIASGNKLLKDAEMRDSLAKEQDILCFEMEAAGLMNHVPCLVIRGICNYCDTHTNLEWQGYAALVAAVYAKQLLQRIPRGKVEGERKANEVMMEAVGIISEVIRQTLTVVADINQQNKQLLSTNFHHQIMRWLSAPDPSTNFNKALSQRHRGTGEWLLGDPRYSRWIENSASFLWLYGIPGCGKTVLITTVINNLHHDPRAKAVLYFYFAFTDAQKQNLDHAIRSLAGQLYCAGHAEVRKHLEACFSLHNNGERQPSVDTLHKVFQQMAKSAEGLWVVLDALDECKEEQQARQEVFDWIQDFRAESDNAHILVAGRPEPDIQSAVAGWGSDDNFFALQSELVHRDVSSFIRWEARHGERLSRWRKRESIQKEIEVALTKKSGGMFRWVSCQLDVLASCIDPESVREALSSMPPTLNETYSQIRILTRLPKSSLRRTKRLLQFLAYSDRPFWIAEAIDVLAVESSLKSDIKNRMPNPVDITKQCGSLIVAVEGEKHHDRKECTTTLQLAHFSVREYLLSNEAPFLGRPICITL